MFGWLLLACVSTAPTGSSPGDAGVPADSGAAADSGQPAPLAPILLALPLTEADRFDVVLGVDHDPTVQDDTPLGRATCQDYVGRTFPHCYDQHDGTDYILLGGFDSMDAGSSPIVAAADGVVVSTEDGHYDRCHADLALGDVSCDGHEMIANHVVVEHLDDQGGRWRTRYWHMKTDSVAVAVDQPVTRGQLLGLVGSSGYSSMPHLHFELQRFDDALLDWVNLDPYAGPYSQALSYWCEQGSEDGLPGGC